ncbi:amidase [Sphaerisporangium krabiense]|uniref:Amidase n=1 Tax=Sphaerisporangium krabiense TaxID=763782 RepID=A0A7W9DT53_9ACTN|nr:amidase [Sphaerisporangium krabiense]MBB5630276.1 amidase [Sphaerisporangium krabiense]GII62773.1 amidase [Sphaerisporangium krabiense]
MKPQEYAEFDATGLARALRVGEVGRAEVEEAAREALESVNSEVNGLALPLFAEALAGSPDGPFAGVPFLIKDSAPMAEGVPFSLGSRALRGVTARHDSDVMGRFRAAGLATLGVTTVPEMGLSFSTEPVRYGPTRNPWDLTRGVGGSSGGAAALVAAGAVPVAHGNDGAGSVRVPASCCGLVGLKPSRGRTPCGPDIGEAFFGMACESALTRTVRDSARLLDALQGPGVGDKYTAPPPARPYAEEVGADPGRLRVAVTTRAWSGVPVDPEVAVVAVEVCGVLARMGHEIGEATPALDWEDVLGVTVPFGVISTAAPLLNAPRRPDPALLEAVTRRLLEEAGRMTALDLAAAFDAQNRLSRSVWAFFTRYDLLVTPTLAGLPAPHGTLRYDDPGHTFRSWQESMFAYGPFTALFNVTGQPAISLPLGQSQGGLPVGVQIVAPYGREDLLFRVAALLEEAMPWRDRVPPVFVR